MPEIRKLAPAACLGILLAAGPFLAAAVLAASDAGERADNVHSSGFRQHEPEMAAPVSLTRASGGGAPARTSPASAPRVHIVARGENLWSIARFYRVSLSELVRVNGISNASRIRVGLRLTIPGENAAPPPAAAPAPAPPPALPAATTPPPAPPSPTGGVHVVARGDNLWSIARFYRVSLSALISTNGIADASRIRTGQRLTIPGGPPPITAPAAAPAPAPAPPPVSAAPAMSPRMAELVAQRSPIRQLITEEATAAGVPVPFALAVAWQESGWRQDVVSSAGAIGVMQLMPGTARWIGEAMLGRPVNPKDARDNVRAGVRLLAYYLARYGGNRDLTLAAYYQGQGAVDRHGIYPVSRTYIASINALVRLFGG